MREPQPSAIQSLIALRGVASALALALSTNAFAAGPVAIDAQAAYTYDDNVTRAARDIDLRADRVAALTLGANWRHTFATHFRLALRAFAQGEQFADYDGLSNIGGGASANLQYRASGTLLAPTYAVFARLTSLNYNSSLRDGELYNAGVSLKKGLTDRIDFTGVLSGTVRQSESLVFDTRDTSLLLNLDYQWTPHLTQYLTYNYLTGDIVASGSPWLPVIDNAEQIQADDAFGGAGANMFAYRLNAQTHVATLGFNFAIDGKQSIDLSARFARAKADGDITYDRNIVSAAYLIRF